MNRASEMVELVANALAKVPCRDAKGVSVGFHDLDIMRRREAARAVLEALAAIVTPHPNNTGEV